MFSFNKPLTCRCGAYDDYQTYADETGQGIKCLECMHKKIVCTAQTPRHRKRFKVRMAESWALMTTKEVF